MSNEQSKTETKAIAKAAPKEGTIEHLKNFLFARKVHIQEILPKGTDAGKMVAAALLSAKNSKALLNCDPNSVFMCVMAAAELGFGLHWGVQGHAAMVPFKNKAQLILGYRGLIELMTRHPEVKNVHAGLIRKGDKWSHRATERGVVFRHEAPEALELEEDERPVIGAYAVAYFVKGGCEVAVVNRKEFEKIRDGVLAKVTSDSYKTREQKIAESPYTTNPEAMWQKRAVRKLSKMVPMSADMARGVEHEETVEREMGDAIRLDMVRPIDAKALPEDTSIAEVVEPSAEPVKVETQPASEAKKTLIQDETTTPDVLLQMRQVFEADDVPSSEHLNAWAANMPKGKERGEAVDLYTKLQKRAKSAAEVLEPGARG